MPQELLMVLRDLEGANLSLAMAVRVAAMVVETSRLQQPK